MDFNEYITEIKRGYFDSYENEKSELFLKYPKFLAGEFTKTNNLNSYKQIRSIYDYVNSINTKIKQKQISWQNGRNQLLILLSKINDKNRKGVVSDKFLEFFDANINFINTPKELNVFTQHLMCICNYYPKDEGKNSTNKFYGNKNNYNKKSYNR